MASQHPRDFIITKSWIPKQKGLRGGRLLRDQDVDLTITRKVLYVNSLLLWSISMIGNGAFEGPLPSRTMELEI